MTIKRSFMGMTAGLAVMMSSGVSEATSLDFSGAFSSFGPEMVDDVFQSNAVTVNGATQITSSGAIALENANNDFVGTVTLASTGGAIAITDRDALTGDFDALGDITIVTGGALIAEAASTNGAVSIMTNDRNVDLNAVTAAQDLFIDAGAGNVQIDMASFNVRGLVTILATSVVFNFASDQIADLARFGIDPSNITASQITLNGGSPAVIPLPVGGVLLLSALGVGVLQARKRVRRGVAAR